VRSDVVSNLETAGRQAADKISAAATSAVLVLERAKAGLEKEAVQAGGATILKWANGVDQVIQKLLAQRSKNELIAQRRRTIQTVAITIIVTLGGLTGLWMKANEAGYRLGYAEGVQSNFDSKERAAWTNTKEG
jgi:hypothetical protein